MVRLWFKDGSHMDVPAHQVYHYEMDPELDVVQLLEDPAREMVQDQFNNWHKTAMTDVMKRRQRRGTVR
jgi:hypothetical protein